MKPRYFTFGKRHRHTFNGQIIDKDCVVKVTAQGTKTPREIIWEHFQQKWAFEHETCPNMKYYLRGIFNLTQNRWE